MRCVIVIKLVEEAKFVSIEEIVRDIEDDLRELVRRIPWAKEVEEIKIV